MNTIQFKAITIDIESMVSELRELIAAEERGVAALQSGEAPSQQLKDAIALLRVRAESLPTAPNYRGFLAYLNYIEQPASI